MLIWMRFPAVTSFLLIIACICVICIYLSYIFCISFCLTVHYHVVISDKEEMKSIYMNPDTFCFEIIKDPDQLASKKPADQDHHCFSLCW